MGALVWVVVGGLSACVDKGAQPGLTPEQKYISAADQTLPVGFVGEAYDAAIAVSGGDSPYLWAPADNQIPAGLTIEQDGHLTGVPGEAGDFAFALLVQDSSGRETRVQVYLQIVLEPRRVSCGDTISGSFRGSAFTLEGPDLTDLNNLEWMEVALPDDLTTRVELQFGQESSTTLYVTLPAETVGSGNIDDDYAAFYLNPGTTAMTVALDAGTTPSLSGYLTQPTIPLLLVAQGSGDWSMTVECSDGPIFVTLPQYPTRLGDEIAVDFNVYGDNTGIEIWTEDPLPDWMIWDRATGQVTGTAMEPGAWEFTVIAETPDGRRREENSIIGVYEVQDVACNEAVDLVTAENYLEGEFYAFYDPRGFGVYRIALPPELSLSSVDLSVTGGDGHYLGLAEPNPDWLRFYGGAERLYLSNSVVNIPVDPESYPAIDHYADELVGELYFSAGSLGGDTSMVVSVDCDFGPRPNHAGFPVIQPLTPTELELEGIGGTPPYTWQASGLPSGISVASNGQITGTTGAIGTYDVDVTITDKEGLTDTRSYDLYVGNDEACDGYKQVQCGDSIDGDFDDAYYNDSSGKGSTKVFCIVDDSDQGLGWEIYSDNGDLRVDVADPGATADEMFDLGKGTYVAYVAPDSSAGVPIDAFSWPNIADYENLPVLVAIRAFDPGKWTVHLVCE